MVGQLLIAFISTSSFPLQFEMLHLVYLYGSTCGLPILISLTYVSMLA